MMLYLRRSARPRGGQQGFGWATVCLVTRDIERLQAATRALAAIHTPAEAQQVMRLAEAARVYARQAELGTEAENAATAIRLKAELRLADVVDEGQKRGEIASRERHPGNVSPREAGTPPATMAELGIPDQRLAEARQIARVMDAERIDTLVENFNERGETLSRAAILREVRGWDTGAKRQVLDRLRAGDLDVELADLMDDLAFELEGVTVLQPSDFKGGYAESDADTAARAAKAKASGTRMREVPLTMAVEEHRRFMENVRALRQRYGLAGTIATVIEAVKREAAREE